MGSRQKSDECRPTVKGDEAVKSPVPEVLIRLP